METLEQQNILIAHIQQSGLEKETCGNDRSKKNVRTRSTIFNQKI